MKLLSKNQAYSLLTQLVCTGSTDAVIKRISVDFPDMTATSTDFLNSYEQYYNRHTHELGNGFVDVNAWKKAWRDYASEARPK